MDANKLAGYIDLTMLRPDCSTEDIRRLCASALMYPFATVCVPPCHVLLAARLMQGSPTGVSTVAGFPLGFQASGVKLIEAQKAVSEGATEVDLVMNLAIFKSGDLRAVEDEAAEVVRASGVAVKLIIETCYLDESETLKALEIAIGSGAAFVKTSTGFGPKGATVEDVLLLYNAAKGRIKVKASGGIRTLDEALAMIRAGAKRVGTSSGVSICEELAGKG